MLHERSAIQNPLILKTSPFTIPNWWDTLSSHSLYLTTKSGRLNNFNKTFGWMSFKGRIKGKLGYVSELFNQNLLQNAIDSGYL
jgi:hypothetical protein